MNQTLKERITRIGIFATAAREAGAVERIISILKPKEFHAGTVIFSEGDEGNEVFVLHKGRVRIRKRTPRGEQYTVVLMDEGQNAFFGEVGLLASERRSATVIAETEVECFVMSKNDFDRLGNDNPKIGLLITREIAKILSQRMKKANEEMMTLFAALVSEVEGELTGQQVSLDQEKK